MRPLARATAAHVITVLIVVAAIGSVFAGLLGGSRVPFEAARDKVFLPVFGRLHPRLKLPTAGVLTMGVITIIGSLFTLTTIINAAVATLVIIQSLAQVAAIVVLRRRRPNLVRPYRQWLYPVPTIIALAAGSISTCPRPGSRSACPSAGSSSAASRSSSMPRPSTPGRSDRRKSTKPSRTRRRRPNPPVSGSAI